MISSYSWCPCSFDISFRVRNIYLSQEYQLNKEIDNKKPWTYVFIDLYFDLLLVVSNIKISLEDMIFEKHVKLC